VPRVHDLRSSFVAKPRGPQCRNCDEPEKSPTQVNPLWGAPRIHGELLKLGIDLSLATVGRYVPRRPKILSPTWQSSLHNHLTDTLAQRPQ